MNLPDFPEPTDSAAGACYYCGANDWFAWEEQVLCGNCLSPEAVQGVDFQSYIAMTRAEQELNRKRFTEGAEPGEYETPEYYDSMKQASRRAQLGVLPPPFWSTLGRE